MHTQCYFYVRFSDFQWYVFNIFATFTLGKRDVNNFEKTRKDSKLQLYVGTPFQRVRHHPKMRDFPIQVTRGFMCYLRAEAVCPFKHVFCQVVNMFHICIYHCISDGN